MISGDTQVNYRVEVNAEEAALIVLDESVSVKITLTSPLLRDANPGEAATTDEGEGDSEFLPREPCLRVSFAKKQLEKSQTNYEWIWIY